MLQGIAAYMPAQDPGQNGGERLPRILSASNACAANAESRLREQLESLGGDRPPAALTSKKPGGVLLEPRQCVIDLLHGLLGASLQLGARRLLRLFPSSGRTPVGARITGTYPLPVTFHFRQQSLEAAPSPLPLSLQPHAQLADLTGVFRGHTTGGAGT